MNELREQIVITRARSDYLSEVPDQVDTKMHRTNADTMEKMLAVVEAIKALTWHPKMLRDVKVKRLGKTLKALDTVLEGRDHG